MEEKLKKAQEILKKHNQEHLLDKYNCLDQEKKEILLNQILNIDFELVKKLYKNACEKIEVKTDEITPIEYFEKAKMNDEDKEKYKKTGENIIKEGGLAVITMAGGQGTRLRIQWTKRSMYYRFKIREKYF